MLLQLYANAAGSSCQARSSRASTRQSPAMPAAEHRVAYLALSADASVAYWAKQVQSAIDNMNLTVLCIAVVSTTRTVASPTIPSSGNSHATSGSFGSSISLLTISLATILWYGFAALPVL